MVGRSVLGDGTATSSGGGGVSWVIRPMTLDDVDAVSAIEAASFTNPWSPSMFRVEVTENPCARFFVACRDHTIVGYVGGWIVADELQVASVAVRLDSRRQGIAGRLLRHLLESADETVRASLEVRRSNEAAIALYEYFGFRRTGIRRGYYDDPKEDAVLMDRGG